MEYGVEKFQVHKAWALRFGLFGVWGLEILGLERVFAVYCCMGCLLDTGPYYYFSHCNCSYHHFLLSFSFFVMVVL